MVTYESAVTVQRGPSHVFSYLVNPVLQAQWSDVTMHQEVPGLLKTGSKIEVTFGKGPLKATLGLEMTDVDQDRRMAFRTFKGPIKWAGEYLLSPAPDGGTNLSQHGTLEFTGLWRLLAPFVGPEIKSAEIKELERLKAAAERP
jgi:hypothetical protein